MSADKYPTMCSLQTQEAIVYCGRPRGARNLNLNATITNACAAVILFGPGSIFASFGWTSTKNVWNAKNLMLSRASRVFVHWITWNSCTAERRRFLSTVYVAFQPLCSPQNKSTVLLQTSLKTLAVTVKSAQYFTSGPKIFHYTKSQICITRLLKIIFNGPQCATHYNLVTLLYYYQPRSTTQSSSPTFPNLRLLEYSL